MSHAERCPVCHQIVKVWQLEPYDRYFYHLKRWWRLWALLWWLKRLSWCPGGFQALPGEKP